MSPLVCLAIAVFFEARGEPIEGQVAVAEVIMNRVSDTRYPDTICEVVFEKKAFSFTHDGLPDRLPSKDPLGEAETALTVASSVMKARDLGITSTHYHATSGKPYWAYHYDLDGIIGNHVFYTNNTPYK